MAEFKHLHPHADSCVSLIIDMFCTQRSARLPAVWPRMQRHDCTVFVHAHVAHESWRLHAVLMQHSRLRPRSV